MAAKKQVPLRLSEKLYNEIAAWAEDDFRSVNGQIEYLLTECVRQRKKDGKYVLSGSFAYNNWKNNTSNSLEFYGEVNENNIYYLQESLNEC